MKPFWLLLLLLMNGLWAAAYSCFKLLAPVMNAGALTTVRFGLAAVMIALVWKWIPGSLPRGLPLLRTAAMGLMVFTVAPRLQVSGVQLGRASDAAVLMAFDPVIVAVAAALFLRERVPVRRWVGFALGIAGVAALAEFWRSEFAWPSMLANALILASFACESVYSVVGKPLIQSHHPLKVLAAGLIAGTIANLLLDGLAVIEVLPGLSGRDWLLLGYLVVVCTVAGYAIWFYAVRAMPVNAVSMTVFMQPLAGVLFALILVAEPLRWSQLAGGAFIGAGLFLGLGRGRSG